MDENYFKQDKNYDAYKKTIAEFYRYLTFWPIFLLSFVFCITAAFLFLRYTPQQYVSETKLEILDKSQDSEMSLPTSMTIFNRSMINLENELGVINSYDLNKQVAESLESNIIFYNVGLIKKTEKHYCDSIKNHI